ncbi:Yip1 family protein [Novosphingobium sp. H3SJ31-1]|uniref:Yip1 family protein n=2 Tax=Novosphingobium album (ex Liu et al. 2023) TaxID=3031130 RepID=A0ABT5WRR3_9SPHN|nr:Yip1 family protein [Novosphingobium album (ex Liu et al. 2023)]
MTGGGNPLVERAKAIILKPKEEWPRIADETRTQGDIFKGYVLPLAAIGPVASFIGAQVFGYGGFGFHFRPSLTSSLASAVIGFVLTVAGVFVLALIADWLAPKFEGTSNKLNAFKLVAYGATASFLAGIFGLIPALGVFGLLGLYSIYLFYTGAPVLMKVPEAKAAGYVAVTMVCAIVLAIVVAPITALITGALFAGPALISSADSTDQGTVSVPGVGSIDVGEVEKMSKRMEDAANGKTKPVEAASLQGLLPDALGAYKRTAVETTGAGNLGSSAQGTYTAGDHSFTLKVTDMHGLGAIAGMGAAMGVEQSREDADGYEKTATVDGQMQTESWSKSGSRGKFGRMVADRFLVEADGNANNIDELKAAVAAIDPDDLEDLAG